MTVEWGTKDKNIMSANVLLLIIGINEHLILNVSQYNGRCFCSWNQQSPGQVSCTLNPIKVVDNQVFIFKFVPKDDLASAEYDTVQLIVKGKNFYYVINFLFHHGG